MNVYFPINKIVESFDYITQNTSNKFWGVLSVLYSLNEQVRECHNHIFSTQKASTFLETSFNLCDEIKTYSSDNEWHVRFSNEWQQKVVKEFAGNKKPKLWSIVCWIYRTESFEQQNEFNGDFIISKFKNQFNISDSDLRGLFDLSDDFWENQYQIEPITAADIRNGLNQIGIQVSNEKGKITAEGKLIESYPGELSRAPFFQTLYAAQGALNCLLITQFDLEKEYNFSQSNHNNSFKNESTDSALQNNSLLTALRTKPFVLLAGISGTGKSRIVRELAKASVTKELQQKYDPQSVANGFDRRTLHKPANFELVQVKPNWHNSLEVVGYKSNIGGAHYEFTPFVEFVARAWQNPEVPFFLCLDEMNLAPVEQYFAEFLSAIESRSFENGEYETDPIVKPFAEFGDDVCTDMLNHLVGRVDAANVHPDSLESRLVERFKTKGLTLPPNLLVLGTVNMDETTFSFSRKVLDRAMSIVMNDVEYDSFFSGESENTVDDMDDNMRDLLIRRPIRGLDVAVEDDLNAVKDYLEAINEALDNTPFKLGYRAANEALLYVSAARQLDSNADINAALDEFTLMKILSRIEGDKRSIDKLLDNLQSVITAVYPKSHEKLVNMAETLNSKQFVSYWT